MSATFHAVGNGEQTSTQASFSITTTISAGDFLVVVSSWDSASATTPTVVTTGGTGSDSGTLILGPTTASSFGLKYAAWLVSSAGTGRTGVTVSWASSSPSFADGYCWSASGLTTPTLDKSPNTSGNSTNPSSGTTGTLSTADQFCVSYTALASATATATGGGFTDDGNTGSTGSRAGHQVVAATTALTGSFTAATSAWVALVLTIKAGSAAAVNPEFTRWHEGYFDPELVSY